MSKVFVTHEPLRRDPATDRLSPYLDMTSAQAYGDLVFLLPPGRRPNDDEQIRQALLDGLDTFCPGDWLLIVGDPYLLAVAAPIIADMTEGRLRLLDWVPAAHRYMPHEIDLYRDVRIGLGR